MRAARINYNMPTTGRAEHPMVVGIGLQDGVYVLWCLEAKNCKTDGRKVVRPPSVKIDAMSTDDNTLKEVKEVTGIAEKKIA